jgi:K+-transporting ATPase ATPase C chain
MKQLRPALIVFGLMTLITGILYPALVTGIAALAFAPQAGGSLIRDGERIVGSSLIGQPFSDPGYFWGRPSATAPAYNAAASSGSNYGPLHPDHATAVGERIAALRAADPGNAQPVPVDLVTASGSGLDPHISPAAASYQIPRVARARGIEPARVTELVRARTEGRTFGVLGEPRVNVLQLNLALDSIAPRR